jgi:hypothetical protein
MVFIDGTRLTPARSRLELVPGSFVVDEALDSLFVYPPLGTDFNRATVEVSVRDQLWHQDFEDNVTIRNLVFENAADPWIEGMAGVRITSSNNLTLEDCTFRSSNWTGLIVSQSTNVVMRRLKILDNGGRGLAVWRLKNALIEDSETSFNNWRGFLDLFTGWTVGNNIDSSHDITVRRHTATNNYARGLWFDSDIVNGVLEESVLRDNKNDGLFIEAAQGPVYVRNNLIENNGRDGIFSGNTEKLHITGNVIRDNLRAAIRLSGRNDGRNVEDFETGERYVVEALDWVIRDNQLSGSGPYVLGTTVDEETWSNFLATLDSDNNDWCHPAFGAVFQIAGGALNSIDQWRSLTGQDLSSTYCAPSTVDVENAQETSFAVSAAYPNPAAQSISLEVQRGDAFSIAVDIYDVLGRRIETGSGSTRGLSPIVIDVSKLPEGLFYILVKAESPAGLKTAVRPVVVLRSNK